MDKRLDAELIESTAGEVADELARRGVAPGQRIIVAIEPDDWIAEARAFSRPLVKAEGWTDAEIDQMIDAARDDLKRG